jgi:hypothetical protein
MTQFLARVCESLSVFNGDAIRDFRGVFVFGGASFSTLSMGTRKVLDEVFSV